MEIINRLIETVSADWRPDMVIIGAFLVAVAKDNRCGLATVYAGHAHGKVPMRNIGSLHEKPIKELVELARSEKPLEASLGMAAINTAMPLDPSRFKEVNAAEMLAEKSRDKNLALVGHFPFANKLRKGCKNCWILELDPREDDLPAQKAEDVIPKSDVVGITASAFSNHTMDRLLELSKDKYVMVIGPTAPLSEVLFDFGVDAIAGAWVTDIPATLRTISQGASFRMVEGVRKILMEKYFF